MTRDPATLLRRGAAALAAAPPEEITALTAAAVASTFDAPWLDEAQRAANARIVAIAAETCAEAATSEHRHLVAAFAAERLAGYVIATRHEAEDLELDWLMVGPAFHGRGVAAALMEEGLAWLGRERATWLNVVRHNARAIAFYRRFGFAIDPETEVPRAVPQWIMRRPAR